MPAGPILSRELLTIPRRPRHYALRAAYAGLFFVLMWTAWQSLVGFRTVQRPSELAAFAGITVRFALYAQLSVALFASALFGVVSIAYEKDRRTLILLLMTRVPDSELIVDKFLNAMTHVVGMLLASAPVLTLFALWGGIGFDQILAAFTTTLAASFAAGAVGVLLATWSERTLPAITLTLLIVAFSLLLAELCASFESEWTWLVGLSPYRAIAAVLGDIGTSPPGTPIAGPAGFFVAASFVVTAVCLAVAVFELREWNPRGEPIQTPERSAFGTEPATDSQNRTQSPDATTARRRTSRDVWRNPILWREIATRAYGARPILVKVAFLVVFAAFLWLAITTRDDGMTSPRLLAARAIAPVAILGLLLVNAQALTSITTERDLKALDLLLVTDVDPKEFLSGKLLGILHNSKEMIAAPIILLMVLAFRGLVDPLGVVYVTGTFLTLTLFGAVLGIHAALRYRSSRVALANGLGTMFLLFVGILLCLFLILIAGRFEAQWLSFILFIVIGSIGLWISLSANAPSNAISLAAATAPFASFYCVVAFVMGDRFLPFLVAVCVYGFAIAAMLVPLVSEFDVATGRTTEETSEAR